jgi:glycolate oxidase iron-sulfur subunit
MTKTRTTRPAEGLERYRVEITRCVKCGSCRAVCPSFLIDREESHSARGRIALIEAVLDGRLSASAVYEDRLDTCTGCLACEAACASGVHVTDIIQAAKEQAVAESGKGILKSLMSRMLSSPRALQSTAWLAPLALHYAPASVQVRSHRIAGKTPSRAGGRGRDAKKGRLIFFPGCATSYFQPGIGAAAFDVLAALGYEVIIPDEFVCCGRPLLSLGDRDAAKQAAERNSSLFADADAVVTVCASCSLTFKKEYPRLLRPEAKRFMILDIHEILAREISGLKLRPVNKTVTWHDPCHLGRGQGLAKTAREVIRAIPGVTLREMKDADQCCGFGGVMRVTHRRDSDAIADRKAGNIIATRAEAVVTGCPSCRMQIADALRRAESGIESLHTLQLLQEALLPDAD